MMKTYFAILFLLSSCFGIAQTTYPSDTWFLIKKDCKTGFMDPSGKVMIEPQFEHVSPFREGLAFVWSFPGYEEDRQNVVLGEDYVNYERFGFEGNRKTGIIDSTGKYVLEPRLNFEMFSSYQDGVALVEINNDIVFIDRQGNALSRYDEVLAEKRMQDIRRVAQFNEALPRKYCFVDAAREAKIYAFDEVKPFFGNRAAVRLGTHFGYVSKDGEMKIVPQFKSAGNFRDGYATVGVTFMENDRTFIKYGVIDTNGVFVIPAIFDFLKDPSNGYVVFGKGKWNELKHGLLNLKGEEIIAPQYEDLGFYEDGLIPAKINKKYGYIDLKNKIVIKAKYSFAASFLNGAASVHLGKEKAAIINTQGNILWGPFDKECR
jgi:hypothetical protein